VLHPNRGCPNQGRAESEEVVIPGGPAIPALELDDDEEVTLVLQLPVGNPLPSEEFCPSLLKVDEILGVVEVAHAIRLGITDPDFRIPTL
jgi:hypothetical protein